MNGNQDLTIKFNRIDSRDMNSIIAFKIYNNDEWLFSMSATYLDAYYEVHAQNSDEQRRNKLKEINGFLILDALINLKIYVLKLKSIPEKSIDSKWKNYLTKSFLEVTKTNKQCNFLESAKTGPICSITVDNKKISKLLCENCALPDQRIICDNLIHPEIYSATPRTRMLLTNRMCTLNKGDSNSICIPGEMDCWEKIFSINKEKIFEFSDIHERIADELDYINLITKNIFKMKLFDIESYRSISELSKTIETEDEFIRIIQILHGIIDSIKKSEILKDIDGNGSLDKMEKYFKEKGIDYNIESILVFRRISRLRQLFPSHEGNTGAIEKAKELGIFYPSENYNKEKNTLLYLFYKALKDLRLSLNII